MPPRKRVPSSSSSSSKKSAHNSQSSQPSKFGIQHFFERHSQTTAVASPTPVNPPPDSHQVFKPLPAVPAVKDDVVAQENPSASPISPEITKSVSVKRVRFSPGMIIKQSQDDGGEEVTWKISPVNEKLRSLAGNLLLGKATALGNASKPSSILSACSERKNSSSPVSVVRLDKWLPSSTALVTENTFACMNKNSFKEPEPRQSCKSNGSVHSDGTSMDEQGPFKTPPSVSYRPGETQPVNGAICSVSPEQLDLHQHRKALLELLDQVEDAISIEEPSSNDSIFVDSRVDVTSELHIDPPNEVHHVNPLNTVYHTQAQTFLLLEVSEKHGTANSSISQLPFKILRLLNEECGQERTLYLCDEWFYSITQPGDTVNVVGEFDNQGKCVVDQNNNFFVVHPDMLISGTRVASSFNCPRRAVFDERLKCTEHSIYALTGTLLHQVFQAGLLKDSPTRDYLEEYARVVLEKNTESLYACGVNEDDMYVTFIEVIPRMLNWLNCYKSGQDPRKSIVKFGQHGSANLVRITEVVDIEEMAWAPKYGLKGMIDASILIKMQSDDGVLVEKVMPLEFKTGKATTGQSAMEHYAQLVLYTLLMSERYINGDIDSGLLYYLHTDQTMGIKAQRSDLVGLIIRRNELATDLVKMLRTQALPPMLQNPTMCRSCRHLNTCTLYHKAHGGSTENSGLGEVFDSRVKHLTSAHYDFMLHWDHLIDLEAKTSLVARKGLFHSGSYRTGQSTNSLSSLVLDASKELNVNRTTEGGQFIYHFVRQGSCGCGSDCHTQKMDDTTVSTNLDCSLRCGNYVGSDNVGRRSNDTTVSTNLDCSLRCGDYVILSTESGRTAVAKGVICGISSCRVSISFFRRLRIPGSISSERADVLGEVWRIDKDEVASSYAIMRYNIVQLFFPNPQNNHLRKLIVDLEAPRFDSGGIFSQDPAISYIRSEKSLNDDQRKAIQKMLTAKDYALILGMPGTGKTSTMVHAVKALLIRGASILLSSYTNSAVDNLLLKLKAQGIDFIRVGRYEAVHDDVRSHCFSATNKCSVEEIKQRMEHVRVVGVTCLGINHPLLANKKFDICILDEAGQITLPVSLGPLMFASKFVLVGDHYQLPPLVQSTEARETGMGLSLFCKLSEAHPQAISALQCQYRMSSGIMELPNTLIYGNRLRCGSSEIANAKLKISSLKHLPLWLREILDPNLPVVFINTDSLPAIESREHRSVNNPAEAHIVSEITRELLNRDIAADEIGIITPYNSQAEIIRKRFASEVEIHTIDRYQGRDKDCIILSFVRSTEISRTCTSSLLGDWRRINVAITRAKKKLIMVGSVRTLSKVPLLKLLIKKVDQHGGILAISKQDFHSFQELKKCSRLSAS